MEKLSLYELLSYVVPGYIALAVSNAISMDSPLQWITGNTLLELSLGLVLGVVIHSFVEAIKDRQPLNFLIYQDIKDIAKDLPFGHLEVIAKSGENYKSVSAHKVQMQDYYPKELFDYAYYYLETKDKIAAAKNLHSLHYMTRNVAVMFFFFSAAFIIYAIFETIPSLGWDAFFGFAIGAALCFWASYYLRNKYVIKILASYYVEVCESENTQS